jgi:predicted nucleic acid-binding protein
MNNIIVDANIIISSLIKKNSEMREFLLREDINYFSPEFVLHEITKHRNKIKKCSELSEDEITTYFHNILKNIKFFRHDLISKTNLKQAYNLCKELDEKDTIYIALTIELNGLLWTGDKKLINGLDKKDFRQTITSTKLFSSY